MASVTLLICYFLFLTKNCHIQARIKKLASHTFPEVVLHKSETSRRFSIDLTSDIWSHLDKFNATTAELAQTIVFFQQHD